MNSCIACDFPVSTDHFATRILPFVFQRLFGRRVARARARAGESAVFGSGSNLPRAGEGSIIWGAGFDDEAAKVPDSLNPELILGLRGRFSARMAADAGVELPDSLAMGNLFEFLPEILPRKDQPAHPFGVLVHPRDLDHSFALSSEALGGRLISPFGDLESVVRSLHECECVFSTSLEGLMICDAYGIPNRWIRIKRPAKIPDFPFHDYYSSRKFASESPEEVHHFWDYGKLTEACRVNPRHPDILPLTREAIEVIEDSLPTRECRLSFAGEKERRDHPTPVFVISYNRLECLKRLVGSVKQSSHPVDLVIHDNGSDFPPLLRYLDALEKEGVMVTRNPKISGDPQELEQVNDTIRSYFEDYSEPVPFVVTDPDISFEDSAPDFIGVYRELLNRFPGVACVGPQLRIHDLPDALPLKSAVIQRQKHYWTRPPDRYLCIGGQDVYLRTDTVIDTTFALYRAGTPFRRLSKAIRVYAPFDARHLDWYETGENEEIRHYRQTSSSVSHWQGEYARQEACREFQLGPTAIFITEPDGSSPRKVQIVRVEV